MRLVIAVCGAVLVVCLGLVGYLAVSEVPGIGERIEQGSGAAAAAPRLPALRTEQVVPLEPLAPPTGKQTSAVDPVVLGSGAGPATAPVSGLTDTERRALDLVSGGTRFSSDGTPVRPPVPAAEAVEQAIEEMGPDPVVPGSGAGGPSGGSGGTGSPPPDDKPSDPSEPAPSAPAPSEPAPSDPVPSDPVEPAPSDPPPSDPVEPVPSDPVEPAPSDPVPSDPVEPAPSDPVPSDPVPSDPLPSDPLPSDPTDVLPSDPVPSDPTGVLPEAPLP